MLIRTVYLFLLCFTLFIQPSAGQEQYMFKRLETKDGLSHSQVNSIFKDSRGFMWFSTAVGLNRYDGYEYKIYQRSDADAFSITDNFVDDVQEDVDGNLWIHTAGGYVFFDFRKEVFTNDLTGILERYDVSGELSLVHIDSSKNLWFYITGVGVYQYQLSPKQLITYSQTGGQCLSPGTVTCMRESEHGMLVLFNNGLIECLDRQSGKVIGHNDYIPTHSTILSDKYTLFVDSDGDCWVYSKGDSGLWIYQAKTNNWLYLSNQKSSLPYRLTSNVIQAVTEDNHKRIWLATDHGGIDIVDKRANNFTNLQHDVFNERSLSQNSINCLYYDDMDIMWVGTYKKGISYYSESLFKFEVDHFSCFRQNRNFENDITYVESTASNDLWIGTNGSGLVYIDRTTGERKLYEHNPAVPASLSSDVIVSLCQGRDGKLWIGTYLGGMNCFDGRTFTHYRPRQGDPNSLASTNVWSILEDEQGYIWIGTLGGGLQRLDPSTGNFTTYSGYDKLSSDFVSSICKARGENTLFIGTAIGINIFYMDTGVFERLQGNRSGTQKFSNQNVNQVYQDSRGLLWIVTRDGLNIYDRKNDNVTILKKSDGLADNFICSIIEDNSKNMWVTTASGVTNIVVNSNPKSSTYNYVCYNYDEFDGLQGREFNMRSIAKTTQGEIIMGGINGYNIFNPDGIKYNENLPKIVFTDIHLFNEEVKVDSVYNGNRILSQSLSMTRKIELDYKQNVFSIGFSGMNYILPEKAKFAYMLEGFNDDWLTVDGNARKITYTNLAPGKYIFRVKASNSDGYWSDEVGKLTIVIRPPFWLSPWAYLIYFLLIMSALWIARFLLVRNERNKFKIHQIELEAQRKHELDDMKLRFFTNVSHELRTPLTLILSPLESLIKNIDDKDHQEKLLLIKRNATRLLNMVNQLLDFRKNDVQGHKLNISGGDIIPLLRNICQSFAELSGKKNIRFAFTSSVSTLMMDFDEDKINKIMMNLLSNAFKFTPDGGSVEVGVAVAPAHDNVPEMLQVSVKDTGEGVKDEDKQRIFERFYQAKNTSSHVSGGSGIGLHLVKDFVELHHGSIEVQDNDGKGSIFIFTIPVVLRSIQAQEETNNVEYTVLQQPEEIISDEDANNPLMPHVPLILIVDDNDDFRGFMRGSLKDEYNIREAVNGGEAWKMIPELQPDIIISDVMMPVIDGIELTRLVKNDVRTSHIPLILLTARTADEHKVEGLGIGADDYLTKPFNFDILSLRIRKMLELRDMKREKFSKQIDPVPSEITITSLDEKLIGKAIKYVEDNMSRSELSVEELSRELGMSRVHLYKKLLTITGKSPVEFIRVIRLKRAAQFLQKSQMNISEIAYEVGFNNPKYFSKYFKEEFGVLPSEYKAKAADNS